MLQILAFAKHELGVAGTPISNLTAWRDFVPAPIIACLSEGRNPSEAEIDAVAAHIWACMAAGRTAADWRAKTQVGPDHQRMIAAARAALGMGSPSRLNANWRVDKFISYYDL